jgi:hypothetical protein
LRRIAGIAAPQSPEELVGRSLCQQAAEAASALAKTRAQKLRLRSMTVSLIGVKSMKITIDDHTNKPAGEFLGKVPTDLTSPALVRVAETRADGCSGRFQAE